MRHVRLQATLDDIASSSGSEDSPVQALLIGVLSSRLKADAFRLSALCLSDPQIGFRRVFRTLSARHFEPG